VNPIGNPGKKEKIMLKKLILLNVAIVILLLVSGCGTTLNVQLPAPDGTTDSAPAPVGSEAAPAGGGVSNMTIVYVLVGLLAAILFITLVALVSSRRNKNT